MMSIEEAERVIGADREAKRVADVLAKEKTLGQCYKFHNSGGGEKRWWLYAQSTKVSKWGHLEGWSFQEKSSGVFDFDPRADLIHIDSWVLIPASEFRRAFRAFLKRFEKSTDECARRKPR